jgi:large subunit ribosomal protein L25
MATQVTLKAEVRSGTGKGVARKLRASGRVPAVVYGSGAEPLSLSLGAHETSLLFHSISVDNTIVNLEVEGQKAPISTLLREIQTHPVRPGIVHVDFLRIEMGVEVELEIPVHLIGIPKGVREDGGMLEQAIHHLPIRCTPANIPEDVHVDVTAMELGHILHVSDLALPDTVVALIDADRVVCSIQLPRVAEATPEAAVAAAPAEPERIGGKKEEA